MGRIGEMRVDREGHRRSSVRSQASVQDGLRHEERLSSYAARGTKTNDDKIHRSLGWANGGKGVVLGRSGLIEEFVDAVQMIETKKDGVMGFDNRRLHISDEADL